MTILAEARASSLLLMLGGPVGAVYVDISVLNGRTASSSWIVCSSNRVMDIEELGLITRIFFDFILMLGSVGCVRVKVVRKE